MSSTSRIRNMNGAVNRSITDVSIARVHWQAAAKCTKESSGWGLHNACACGDESGTMELNGLLRDVTADVRTMTVGQLARANAV
ncbi:unnamed protein product [Colias eurytheme]|nr:unnamed protein product [Colias eurytheme]